MVEGLRGVIQNAARGVSPGLYVMRRCVNTIMEFQTWAFKRTASGELPPKKDTYCDFADHAMDVLVGMVATGDLVWHDSLSSAIEVCSNG